MDKVELIDKIEKVEPVHFTKDRVLGWVGALEKSYRTSFSKITTYKKGDVHMHPVFLHPYVLLDKSEHGWICVLLTSETKCPEILEPCQSRFFTDSYFTKVMFTTADPIGEFGNVFDNPKQLNSILKKLKEIFI